MGDFDLVVRGDIVDADGVEHDGWLAVREGKVVLRGRSSESDAPSAREQVDARGMWVLPGVVDGQVHSGSQAKQEGLGWASRAAAAGGVTVMVDMPYDDPEPVASRPQLDAKIAEVERDCHVDVALYGTLNDKHGLQAAAGLIEGGVCAFKFSTFEATPGRFPRIEEDDLYEAFRLERRMKTEKRVRPNLPGCYSLHRAVAGEPTEGPLVVGLRSQGEERPPGLVQRDLAGDPAAPGAEALDSRADERADICQALRRDAERGMGNCSEHRPHLCCGRRDGAQIDRRLGLQHPERGQRVATSVSGQTLAGARPHLGERRRPGAAENLPVGDVDRRLDIHRESPFGSDVVSGGQAGTNPRFRATIARSPPLRLSGIRSLQQQLQGLAWSAEDTAVLRCGDCGCMPRGDRERCERCSRPSSPRSCLRQFSS